MRLCTTCSTSNSCLILELNCSCLTSLYNTISYNEELVVPRLTRILWLLDTSSFSLSFSVLTLQTIYSDFICIGINSNGLLLVIRSTLEHLKCHSIVLSVNVNLPYTKTRNIQSLISRLDIVKPLLSIVVDLTTRHQGSALESSIVTTSGRNHQLVNVSIGSTLCTNCSLKIGCASSLERNSVIQIIVILSLSLVDTSQEEAFVQLQVLPREVIEVELNSILNT